MPRILAIGLDGFEETYGSRLLAEGALPELAAMRDRGALVLLDHGPAQRTGLAWEHFWSGLSPEAGNRHAAVEFDPTQYLAWQEGARFEPFFAGHSERVVIFDAPYADLDHAPEVRGVVAWGSHDPGITGGRLGRPDGIVDEINARFGPYPATEWTYATPWASPEACTEMGTQLAAGVDARREAAGWLLSERLPDWDLAIVVVAELHSAVEGLWHGIDPEHPLHHHRSAPAAGESLRSVHIAADRLVGDLTRQLEPDVVVVFTMGGMGPNESDLQSMVLLPELMHRWSSGGPALVVPDAWSADPSCIPNMNEGPTEWDREWFQERSGRGAKAIRGLMRFAAEHLPQPLVRAVRNLRRRNAPHARSRPGFLSLGWQPASWYRHRWSKMAAFAIPSYYDGRIRINLRGREAHGIVDPADYDSLCEEVTAMLQQCTDPRTGRPSVAFVERPGATDPLAIGSSGCDIAVIWNGAANAISHPEFGLIGPVPFRRTGGHTGRHGSLLLVTEGVRVGDVGIASAFDVAPTLLTLLGGEVSPRGALAGGAVPGEAPGVSRTISGRSLLPRLMADGQKMAPGVGLEPTTL